MADNGVVSPYPWEYSAYILSNPNDVSLLTQTNTHWNFAKTEDAKIHWYYYFKDQAGADFNGLKFTTDHIKSISITMRNNVEIGNDHIFISVYTVGTENGWYGNKYIMILDPYVSTELSTYTVTLPDGVINQDVLAIAFSTNSTAPDNLNIDIISGRFVIKTDTYGWDLELLS